jgi:alkylation response protein AidB-like acyl-CoA dehydrogenase
VNFALSEDHLLLRDSAQNFVDQETDLRKLLIPGSSVDDARYEENWLKIKALGWPSLVVMEEYGGAGLDCIELSVIAMETGRTLLPSPFAGQTLGTWALMSAGSEKQKQRLLPGAATGDTGLALVPPVDGNHVAATDEVLSGSHEFVIDGACADFYIVAAIDADNQWAFYLVDAKSRGVSVEILPWRDVTRQVCEIRFESVVGERMPGAASLCWRWMLDRISLLLAAENAGGLRRVLTDTVEYANERVAFGRQIGSYQAIKHPLAEMLGKVESANTAVMYAAWALASDDPKATLAASLAKAFSSDAYCDATHRSIQIFGAIGFTWEMPNHLFYKRARANAALFGDAREHRDIVVNEATGKVWSQPGVIGGLERVA